MPINMTPEEYAEKQARRLKGAIEDIRAGVSRVTESPTAKAATKSDKMLAGVQRAVQSGKWGARLKAVSLDEWKQKTIEKGLGRISSGIDGAHDKVVSFAAQLLPYQADLQKQIEKMPDLTLEDSLNRMVTFIRGMSKFQRK
ncbi:MAG: hypothetical protein PHR42_04150 [Caldisericia bacterium]|nr:hypothetical protein [Caldisericia bacterium]